MKSAQASLFFKKRDWVSKKLSCTSKVVSHSNELVRIRVQISWLLFYYIIACLHSHAVKSLFLVLSSQLFYIYKLKKKFSEVHLEFAMWIKRYVSNELSRILSNKIILIHYKTQISTDNFYFIFSNIQSQMCGCYFNRSSSLYLIHNMAIEE